MQKNAHEEMISAEFLGGNALLRGELQIDAMILSLKKFGKPSI